ncbi:hypothetical protein [Kordia sp.]|uniref:hypothetical protein n=1 Tax=Kordia sp. TaxID=1965332 RepID=UPI003B5A992D
MNEQELIKILNKCWDEKGFLFQIRNNRNVDFDLGNNLVDDLKKFTLETNSNLINYKLVRLIWFIPIFLTWQKDRLISTDEITLKKTEVLINKINNEVIKILGCP